MGSVCVDKWSGTFKVLAKVLLCCVDRSEVFSSLVRISIRVGLVWERPACAFDDGGLEVFTCVPLLLSTMIRM